MNKLVERRITFLKKNPLDEKLKIKSLVDGDFAINRGDTIEYHFHNKKKPLICKINDLTGCYIITSNVPRNDGYVMLSVTENGRNQHYYAHRKIYATYNGEIEHKKTVMHECDNPMCVNPNHLKLGTHKDNMLDKERKGRGNQVKGEFSSSSKLTIQDVIFVKNNLDKYTDQEFANIYGIVYQNFYGNT